MYRVTLTTAERTLALESLALRAHEWQIKAMDLPEEHHELALLHLNRAHEYAALHERFRKAGKQED